MTGTKLRFGAARIRLASAAASASMPSIAASARAVSSGSRTFATSTATSTTARGFTIARPSRARIRPRAGVSVEVPSRVCRGQARVDRARAPAHHPALAALGEPQRRPVRERADPGHAPGDRDGSGRAPVLLVDVALQHGVHARAVEPAARGGQRGGGSARLVGELRRGAVGAARPGAQVALGRRLRLRRVVVARVERPAAAEQQDDCGERCDRRDAASGPVSGAHRAAFKRA